MKRLVKISFTVWEEDKPKIMGLREASMSLLKEGFKTDLSNEELLALFNYVENTIVSEKNQELESKEKLI